MANRRLCTQLSFYGIFLDLATTLSLCFGIHYYFVLKDYDHHVCIKYFVIRFDICIACSYCGKDFQSLGRHSWRCKKRLNNTREPHDIEPTILQRESESNEACKLVKCSCGKECKGLKMHQRRCRVLENMGVSQPSEFEISNLDPRDVTIEQEKTAVKLLDTFVLKQGIRLPKSSEQWTEANNYFRSIFANIILRRDTMDETIKFMNNSLYDFFKANYCTI